VDVDLVAEPPVERRDHVRLAFADEADVADEALVEDRVDRRAVVDAAARLPTDAGAVGGRPFRRAQQPTG
jgi:hypothetical protein